MAKITNEEKYKTVEEREKAFCKFCATHDCASCPAWHFDIKECVLSWLALEVEEEKPEPCPNCNGKCVPMESSIGDFFVACSKCYYRIGGDKTEADAIAAHNRVCRAVKAAKEGGNDLDFVRKTVADVYCLRDGSVAASCSNAWEAVNKIKDRLGMIRKTEDKDLKRSEENND